jgi:hypothetical protein
MVASVLLPVILVGGLASQVQLKTLLAKPDIAVGFATPERRAGTPRDRRPRGVRGDRRGVEIRKIVHIAT